MLNEATEDKLKAMKLTGMLTAWVEQRSTPTSNDLAFDERFGLIVDAEELSRDNRRLKRSLTEAKLKVSDACIEGIDYPSSRRLDRALVRQLASCRWVAETQHVTITGATGTGKTYVACALAHQACRKGYRALYRRMPRLFQELRLARADGTYPRYLARLARTHVLVVDDFGIAPDPRRVEIEPRIGGRFTFSDMREEGEAVHWGTYLEIDRPRKLVFTWFTSEEDERESISIVTLTIEPDGEGCVATVEHEMDVKWADYTRQVQKGWGTMLAQIDAMLAGEG
jgi:hypothetical protein